MKRQNDWAVILRARLIRILVAAFAIAVLCYFFTGLREKPVASDVMMTEAFAAPLQFLARMAVAEAAAADSPSSDKRPQLKGQAVYDGLCFGCHRDGLAGAPRFGDKKAWGPRIAQGFDALVKHAIEGFTGKTGKMPPKGGGTYVDVEVARAVAYMANHAGATFPEPDTLAE